MKPFRTITPSRPVLLLPRWDGRPLDRTCIVPIVATGLVIFALTCIMAALPLQPPVVRPMLGALVAIMLLSRTAAWPAFLFAGCAGMALAGAALDVFWSGLCAGAATAAGAGVAAYGWKAASGLRLGPNPLVRSAVFVGIAAGATPAAALVATILAPILPTPAAGLAVQDLAVQDLAVWGVSDGLGVLLLAWPAALGFSTLGFAREMQGRRQETWLLVTVATLLAGLLMWHGPMTCILLMQPLLLLAAFRLNGIGLSALLIASAGAATITAGWLTPGLVPADILSTQIFFACTVLSLLAGSIILQMMRSDAEATEKDLEDSIRANQAKSDFLAVMSHDIRIPLTSMIGFADLLSATGSNAVVTGRAKLIHDAGLCILRMVEDIQKFATIEAHDHAVDPHPTRLRDLLSATIASMEPQAQDRQQTLQLNIASDVADWVMADAPRLRQVITNLVSNAVKFGHDGKVEVILRHGREAPGRLFFAVRDNGPGLTEEEQSILFRPLMRLNNAATRAVSGTGLGLAICRRIVEAMPDGVIGVTSSPGLGSTFWFEVTLPPCPAPTSLYPVHPEQGPEIGRNQRILVAEDSVAGQKIIAAFLDADGDTAMFVADGKQAIAAAKAGTYDLILMDMDMPVMDGLAATRAIRKAEAAGQHVRIIALSGSVSPQDIERCRAAGMDGHLAKPIDREALRAELLRHSRHVDRPA